VVARIGGGGRAECHGISGAELDGDVVVGLLDLAELGDRVIDAAGDLGELFAFAFGLGGEAGVAGTYRVERGIRVRGGGRDQG
jgi:hypothetical protein